MLMIILAADSSFLDRVIRKGCEDAITAEPNLTKWDMVMGDGDCGEAVYGVSKGTWLSSLYSSPKHVAYDQSEDIIKLLDSGIAKRGSVFDVLYAAIDAVDDMGGTLGAVFGIFLAALATSLRSLIQTLPDRKESISPGIYAKAVGKAVETLKGYTGAREGDRTVMDVLLPFAAAFEKSGNFAEAVKVAKQKAEATRYLRPKFGRASYVGKGGKEQELPDPGAWALMELLSGMLKGMS
jgi:dihydroxyacetone kinase